MSKQLLDFVIERTKLIRAIQFEIDFATRGLDEDTREDLRRAIARVVTNPDEPAATKKTIARLLA